MKYYLSTFILSFVAVGLILWAFWFTDAEREYFRYPASAFIASLAAVLVIVLSAVALTDKGRRR